MSHKLPKPQIFSRMVSIGILIASLGVPLMMWIYEATGVFQNVFVFCFFVDIVIIGLVLLVNKMSKTLKWMQHSSDIRHA